MKKHVQIKDSYNTWKPSDMKNEIEESASGKTGFLLVVEWWLHNIVYWLTKPFRMNDTVKKINDRCKDVDLEVESEEDDEQR